MKDVRVVARAVISLFTLLIAVGLSSAKAEIQSGQVVVQAVSGSVMYASEDGVWKPVTPDMSLGRGVTIKTGPDATVDLLLNYNGTVLRMVPNTTVEFA